MYVKPIINYISGSVSRAMHLMSQKLGVRFSN